MGVDHWAIMVGIGLVAAVGAGVGFVRYRERETEQLRRGASLATELRALAVNDPVRLAAVDEYELALYQRLFFVSTVSPRLRSSVWGLLGALLAAAGALVTRGDGLLLSTVHWLAVALLVIFGLSTLFFVGLAAFHAATTPRVSFVESYAAAQADSPDSPAEGTESADTAPTDSEGDADATDREVADPATLAKE